jgi:hypothetical protein
VGFAVVDDGGEGGGGFGGDGGVDGDLVNLLVVEQLQVEGLVELLLAAGEALARLSPSSRSASSRRGSLLWAGSLTRVVSCWLIWVRSSSSSVKRARWRERMAWTAGE